MSSTSRPILLRSRSFALVAQFLSCLALAMWAAPPPVHSTTITASLPHAMILSGAAAIMLVSRGIPTSHDGASKSAWFAATSVAVWLWITVAATHRLGVAQFALVDGVACTTWAVVEHYLVTTTTTTRRKLFRRGMATMLAITLVTLGCLTTLPFRMMAILVIVADGMMFFLSPLAGTAWSVVIDDHEIESPHRDGTRTKSAKKHHSLPRLAVQMSFPILVTIYLLDYLVIGAPTVSVFPLLSFPLHLACLCVLCLTMLLLPSVIKYNSASSGVVMLSTLDPPNVPWKMTMGVLVGFLTQSLPRHFLILAIVLIVLVYVSTASLDLPCTHNNTSDLPLVQKDTTPPYGRSPPHSRPSLSRWISLIIHTFYDITSANADSRRIFYFLCLTFSFMFVEIGVGLYSGSLGLISDAGHMFFDSAALMIGLCASYVASAWRSDHTFTYGYGRFETIAGFVNAVFLMFVAVFVLTESLERFLEPPKLKTDGLLATSAMGLAVNVIGLVFFHEHHGGGGGGHSHAGGGHSHGHHDDGGECCDDDDDDTPHVRQSKHKQHARVNNENMHGVYLHVLADALGSIGVITSSLLIQWYGWWIADPICSFFISILIFMSVLPLLRTTAESLMLKSPSDGMFEMLMSEYASRTGVKKISQAHLWRQSKTTLVATLHISFMPEATLAFRHVLVNELSARLQDEVKVTDLTVQGDVE